MTPNGWRWRVDSATLDRLCLALDDLFPEPFSQAITRESAGGNRQDDLFLLVH